MDQRELAVDRQDLAAGVHSDLCNSTSASVEADVDLVAEAASWIVVPDTASIGPGSCVDITVTLPLDAEVTDTNVVLVAIGPGGGVARRTITVKSDEEITAPFTSAIGTIDLHGPKPLCEDAGPAQTNGSAPGTSGPTPNTTPVTSLPPACDKVTPVEQTIVLKYETVDPPNIISGQVIATLANDGDVASLVIAGTGEDQTDGAMVVPVDLVNVDKPGAFTGQLDTDFAGSEDKPVAVTFNVTAAAKDALSSLDLHGTFNRHSRSRPKETGIVLRYEGSTPPPIAKDSVIAVLASGDDTARLVATSAAERLDTGTVSVRVELQGAGERGTYKGSFDTQITGTDAAPVAVTFTVGDNFQYAFAMLLVGLVIGLLVKWLAGRVLVRWRWQSFRKKFGQGYYDAYQRFAKSNPTLALRFSGPTDTQIRDRKAEIKEATKRYAKTTVLLDPADPAYQSIVKAISDVHGDIDVLGSDEKSGLATAIKKLDKRILKFASEAQEQFPTWRAPKLLRSILELANQSVPGATSNELGVGGATKFVKDSESAITLMDRWNTQAQRLRRLRVWVSYLIEFGDAAGLDESDMSRIQRAATRLREAHIELFTAVDAGELDADRIEQDLDHTYEQLAALAGKCGIYVPSDWEKKDLDLQKRTQMTVAYVAPSGNWALLTMDQLRLEVGQIPRTLESAADFLEGVGSRALMRVVEFAIVLVAALPTYATFRTQYDDKPWGTLNDVLTLIVVAVGAEAITGGLFGLIKSRIKPRPVPTLP